MTRHVVEVRTDEVTAERGICWLASFESAYRSSDRLRYPASGVAEVVCDGLKHASMLAGRMHAEGVPLAAVQVREVRT